MMRSNLDLNQNRHPLDYRSIFVIWILYLGLMHWQRSNGYFDSPESLINAAFNVQRQQERRVNSEQSNGAMLGKGRCIKKNSDVH